MTDTTLNQIDEAARWVIERLSEEAGAHGDQELRALCHRALEGDPEARAAVDEAMAWAAAQLDEVTA
jgi:predicted NBD/HSP70 family sugar kinase